MTIEHATEFGTMREALASLLRAWRVELAALARERFPQIATAPQAQLAIDVYPGRIALTRLHGPNAQEIASAARGADGVAAELARLLAHETEGRPADVVVRFDASLTLRPSVRLPRAAHATMRAALRYEIERLAPVEPDLLCFDYAIHPGKQSPADIDLRIVQRGVVDEAVALCHAAGAAIGGFGFIGDAREADWRAFPVDRPAFLRRQWRRWGNHVLAVAAGLLFLAVLVAGIVRAESTNADLSEQVDDAASRALVVERLEHKFTATEAQLAYLAAKRQAPMLVETLAELTRTIPDSAWISEVSIQGTKIHLQGYAKNASALIPLIDRSGTFANAQFEAPVVRSNTDGTDRFDLSFDVMGRRSP